LCNYCRRYGPYAKCHRELLSSDRSYPNVIRNECVNCHRRDPDNVDRYCIDRMIGYRTWCGTAQDNDVGDFVRRHQNDISFTFEISRCVSEVIKYYFEMQVEFYRNTSSETDIVQYRTARFYIPQTTFDVNELTSTDYIIGKFVEKLNDFNEHQNIAWIISRIDYLHLCWGCYQPPITGSFIPTPEWILTKRAIVNALCFDDNSFQYSVLVAMILLKSQVHNRNYPSHYERFMHLLNMGGIPTPVHLSSIDKFENQNSEISVNVFHPDDDDSDIISVRTSKLCSHRKYHVNLLMLFDRDKFHYTSVRSLSRLFAHHTKHAGKNTCVNTVCMHSVMNVLQRSIYISADDFATYLPSITYDAYTVFFSKDTCTEYAIIHT